MPIDAESGEGRVLIPFQIAGVQQIMHIVPPVVTNPTTTSGPRTGLGDGNHTSATPVGLGLGKVIQLDAGYTLNTYAEIQPSLYRSGVGAPNYQVFTGISLQLPLYFTSGWHLF